MGYARMDIHTVLRPPVNVAICGSKPKRVLYGSGALVLHIVLNSHDGSAPRGR